MARHKEVIWISREQNYFCERGWTARANHPTSALLRTPSVAPQRLDDGGDAGLQQLEARAEAERIERRAQI
jgi:hypothetical protein